MSQLVTVLTAYPFHIGQKIRIEGNKRAGDWEVTGIEGSSVTLRCPISKKEYTWDNFCYMISEETDGAWPKS